jgi:hypothetical protein
MEALFGCNKHGGDKAADLASFIIVQAALEVPRLLGLLAMVKVSSFLTPYNKSCYRITIYLCAVAVLLYSVRSVDLDM